MLLSIISFVIMQQSLIPGDRLWIDQMVNGLTHWFSTHGPRVFKLSISLIKQLNLDARKVTRNKLFINFFMSSYKLY